MALGLVGVEAFFPFSFFFFWSKQKGSEGFSFLMLLIVFLWFQMVSICRF